MKKEEPGNHLLVLTELKKAVSEGNIVNLRKLNNSIVYTNNAESQVTLRDYYDNASNPIRSTNLVILACQHNQVKILEYLFGSDNRILNNLPAILPDDKDEALHNAFYYATRLGNTQLLNTLIHKWPNNHFAVHLEELDDILSKAYEELKLKNVPLSDEIQIFVENELINLRFFSNTFPEDPSFSCDLDNVKKRINLILQSISFLTTDYSYTKEVDQKFLFVTKFIAQNINILKRQLKSTYIRLPWEEMEFCLVSFISSHTKRQEINLFYCATLDKSKILIHLENFAKKLEDEKDVVKGMKIGKLTDLPKLKREKVVAGIMNNSPQFEELYKDYRQIRDIHSLDKINVYVKLALSVDPNKREGQLVITRALQVIGEHLKNTLESPKLSNTTSDLLLLSLQKNARKIIVDLRNSLSHAYSLSKRIEIEKNSDVNFFINVQNDTRRVGDVIANILYNNKIKTIKMLLKKIVDSENFDEITEVIDVLGTVEIDKMISKNFRIMEHEKLEKLVKNLSDNVNGKTNYEIQLFNKINSIINGVGTQSENIRLDYITGLASLKSLSYGLGDNGGDQNLIRGMKFRANHTLTIINPKIEAHDLKEIAGLARTIFHSAQSRMEDDQLDEVTRIICEIFYIVEFGTGDIKWIEELREKLNKRSSFLSTHKQRKACNVTEEEYNSQLALKLSELKSIFCKNSLIERVSFYKSDKKLQAVVEMLVLDIMSILGSLKNCLENNLLFLDDNTPLLTGKSLRNHLAHDNALVDLLSSDPLIAVVLNAKKLTEENIISNKKIGKLVTDDPLKLKEKYDRDLVTITNQERMFAALEEGNLESLKNCLRKGTDVNATSINGWTTLHFAARGPNLAVTKFILDQNLKPDVKDINGQTPLHVAAAYGRSNIVEFFLKETNLHADNLDNSGKTPLHFAAENGHKDTVEVLLKNKANTVTQDASGLSPLYYAIRNNRYDVAKVFLKNDDINEAIGGFTPLHEAIGGFTPLHEATESGHLELVNFLLENKADVNARNDRNWMPLHAAAFNGHLEIVNALILTGANVNAIVINGCTPLHYAVESGCEKIVNILLKHGANVNAVEKIYKNTALHYAANGGNEGIVTTLLENKANASVATTEGITPLHLAVQGGHLEIASGFLKLGVDIHAKDKNNATPLHYAVKTGQKEAAKLLIRNGAEINSRTSNNQTPLHAAALKGHKDVIELLIKNEAEVNARSIDGMTPLHVAVRNGHEDAVGFLIESEAEINVRDNSGLTPLHGAVLEGHKDVVNFLMKNKAQVGVSDGTLLHTAIEAGHKEIVEILVANGANINVRVNLTPLVCAVRYNHKEIVEFLIAKGANVNAKNGEALSLAVLSGYTDIVEILLKNKACVNMKVSGNLTPLHLAAKRGHRKMVNALITRGADVTSITTDNVTPLYLAAGEGCEAVVEDLITGGANVNVKSQEGFTPLHMAATSGHSNVVQILLDNRAIIDVTDNQNRTPLELAVSRGRLQVVKTLLQCMRGSMAAKGNDDYTILHIASQESNLAMVKYLVGEGCDINAKNVFGSKSIHIAAKEGHKDTVEFFLSKGLSINVHGAANRTPLHYAAMKGYLETVEYLILQGADVNSKDTDDLTPMHIAANFGFKNVIEVLLQNNAVYNATDKVDRKPLQMAKDKKVIKLLTSTEKLFEAVKRNNPSDAENYIKAGAFVNAKNVETVTPLHYAAWKGYEEVVNILLQNKANPNVAGNKGLTPLHYAAKFSHLKVVKALLSNYAVYNPASDSGKTPSDFTEDKSITSLFKLLDDSFRNIKNGNSQVVRDLNTIKDIDTVKAIMGACNTENKTLVAAAVHNKFSQIEQLKEISQGDISTQLNIASDLFNKGNYQNALPIFKNAFEKRKEILGSDNPGTLDIQTNISHVLYAQGAYHEALNTYKDIFRKQKAMLGLNNKDTLNTRSSIALVLHRLGKNEEAFNIYQEVYEKQREMLGLNHSDTLNTQFHLALVLERLGKYEEALKINRAIFEQRKETLGANDPSVVRAQNNIAMVLASQGNYEESLKIYEEVFEKKKVVLGVNHSDTLRTLHNISGVLCNQKKYHEALKAHQEVLNIQKNVLGSNHPDTLNTRYNMGNVLFAQGKWIGALKTYREALDQMETVFGSNHPSVLEILEKIETLNLIFKIEGSEASEILLHLQKDIAASNDSLKC